MSPSLIMRDLYKVALMHLYSLKEKNQYLIPAIVAGCVVLAIAGLCFLYYSHMKHKEYTAQIVLAECMEEYAKAREGNGDWATVELMAKAGYEKFAATKAAVYFIPLRVDALLALDQRETVMTLLQNMLQRLGTSSALYPLFQTKLALIKLDDADTAVQGDGLKLLQELAYDTHNNMRDMALFYLMQYYRMQGNTDGAEQALMQLKTLQTSADIKQDSPWASLAEEAKTTASIQV